MTPTRLLVVVVVAHVLLCACAKLTPEQAKKLQNVSWKDAKKATIQSRLGHKAVAAKGHRVGQTAGIPNRACLGADSSKFKWTKGTNACTSPIDAGAFANVQTSEPAGTNTKVWTLDTTNVAIQSSRGKSLTLDFRGSTLSVDFTDTLNSDFRFTVEEQDPHGAYYMYANPEQWDRDEDQVEYYIAPRKNEPYEFYSEGTGQWRIVVSYWGVSGNVVVGKIPLVVSLNCWDPDENAPIPFLAFDTEKKTCDTVCWPGYHMMPGTYCLAYQFDSEDTQDIGLDTNGPNPGLYAWGATATFDLPKTTNTVFMVPRYALQADVFSISATAAAPASVYILVGEVAFLDDGEGGLYATNLAHKELHPPFDETFQSDKASGGVGVWLVFTANWDLTTDLPAFDPSFSTGSFKCDGNRPFEGPVGYPDGHPLYGLDFLQCAAPLPENVCAYNKLGFNPFERWNVFASGDSKFAGITHVEGSVASICKLKLKGAAEIHTVKEAYLKSAPFSVQAGSVVISGTGSNAVVKNGGVETSGVAEIAADKVEGEIKQNADPLSVDLTAANQYYITRSMEWSEHPDSVVEHTLGDAENEFGAAVTTLTLRLHGKVNFFKISSTQFATLRQIILTGHPVGTAIINVEGDTDISRGSEALSVNYKNAAGELKQPTFGRLLLNFYEMSTNCVDLGFLQGAKRKAATQTDVVEEDAATTVSILAPFAKVKVQTSWIRGNIIAKDFESGSVGETFIDAQPFGTFPKSLNPKQPRTPKEWTATGKRAVACLWKQL